MYPEDEEGEYEDTELGGLPPIGGLPGVSAADAFKASQDAQRMVQEQVSRNRAMLESAANRLREQRVGPSAAERLFAISRAFSAPTRTGRFGERMGIVGGVLGEQEKEKRAAELARAELLEKYGMASGNELLKALQAQSRMAGQTYGQAARMESAAGKKKTGFNPVTGELVYMDTGASVSAPAMPKIGEVQQGYEYIGGDPGQPTSWRKVD